MKQSMDMDSHIPSQLVVSTTWIPIYNVKRTKFNAESLSCNEHMKSRYCIFIISLDILLSVHDNTLPHCFSMFTLLPIFYLT